MINVDSVLKSYTGKVGCMCGCNGTYKVASKHLNAAGVERGYAYDDDEVSDRSVKMGRWHTSRCRAYQRASGMYVWCTGWKRKSARK